jgi:hypothetical protein
LFNVNRTVHSAWNWFGASQQQFLNPFEYYQLKDYRFAIGQGWRQLRMKFGPVHLDGIDLRRLFEAELKGAFCDDSCLECILSYRLPKRLAANGIRVDLLIDEFENMVPDKLLNLGFRRYLPATRIVGFQHGALFPLLLCNFMTSGEAEFAPMPDRVVCNGSFFRDILVSEGLPAEIATVGPALRYEHLRGLMSQQSSRRDEDVNILVPLPLVIDSAVELFSKVSGALGDLVNVRVLLKAHPMSSAKPSQTQDRERPVYENDRYWNQRLEKDFSLAGVGHAGVGLADDGSRYLLYPSGRRRSYGFGFLQ